MRLLVTGGCGFIGSSFVRYMLSSHPDFRVTVADLLTYAGNRENLAGLEEDGRLRIVVADIADEGRMADLFRDGFDAVVNFAAESHVDRSIEDARDFVRTNVLGTQVLLEAARRRRVDNFVQISTDEVYGPLELDDPERFTEASPLRPTSPYAASKAAADLLCLAAFRTYGQHVTITRCSNNYGPRQFPEKFLPQMILNALEGKPLPIYGDGLYVRDWIHVEDHCRALEIVMLKGEAGEVYNIGADSERPNIQIAREVLQLTGRPESMLEHVADRPGHDRRYAVDASRIHQAFGWTPRLTFDDGLAATVRWYKDNRPWWRRIVSGDYLVDRREARMGEPGG
ncbi:MAG TPA: dTDP-glucose 4,6-dehydratase [Candidatus Saccharimonadales bacterium]|nr:dTDP-glucose 4,6-dehydratase [Candidatus Saccharimonadales bacterium]